MRIGAVIKRSVIRFIHRPAWIAIVMLFLLWFGSSCLAFLRIGQLRSEVEYYQAMDRQKTLQDEQVVTKLSSYFENKGNLTIQTLLATVNQLQSDETTMQHNIDVNNGNVTTYNNNMKDIQAQLSVMQSEIMVIHQAVYGY